MKCKICRAETKEIFKAKILNKYNTKYYYCGECGFLQIGEPFWLEEAYSRSIVSSDTGLLNRNISMTRKTGLLIYFLFNKNAKFLDFAGGYGVFTRLMRDIGFDFYWFDKYSNNIFARGFEYDKTSNIELITSFESFEHFINPIERIKEMLMISRNIFFSTLLMPLPIPSPGQWWYYDLNNGQHISFYSLRTLRCIADMFNLKLYTNGFNLHLLTEKKISNSLFKSIMYLSRTPTFWFISKKMKGRISEDSFKMKNLVDV
jgi:hypothetical protein